MPKHSYKQSRKQNAGSKKRRNTRRRRAQHVGGGGCGCSGGNSAFSKLFFGGAGNQLNPTVVKADMSKSVPATLVVANPPPQSAAAVGNSAGGNPLKNIFSGGAPAPIQRGGGWFSDIFTSNYLINTITGTYTSAGMSGTNSILTGSTPINTSPASQNVEFYNVRNPRLA